MQGKIIDLLPKVDAGKDYRPTTDLRIKRESNRMIYELTMKYEIYSNAACGPWACLAIDVISDLTPKATLCSELSV